MSWVPFSMRFCLLVGVLSVTLAGCAGSPPARYYTLRAPIDSTPVAVTAVDYLIEVLPVSVPAQVDQPQIMLRFGPGTVLPLSSDRWVAPLGEELQVALSDVLKRELPALDVHALRFPQPRAAVWRIELDVQRFDMVAQQAAIIDATWRIRSMNTSGQTLLCRSLVTLPTQDTGIAPLVAAQQRAIGLLGATIAAAIRAGGHLRSEAALPAVQNLGCVEQG